MIVRVWGAIASAAESGAYPAHFRETVLPALNAQAGFLGAELLKSAVDDRVAFLVLTRWRSLEAIRAFAGDQVERAVVEPAAARVLLSFEAKVRHYEVLEEGPLRT